MALTPFNSNRESKIPVMRDLWWLNPSFLFPIAAIGSTLVAILSPDKFYEEFQVRKFIDWHHFWLAVITSAAWIWGISVGKRIPLGPLDSQLADRRWLVWWFGLAMGLTTLGYTIWTFIAIQNGLSLNMIMRLLFVADESTFEQLKDSVFTRIPGITSATQFGMAAMMIGIVTWKRGEKWVFWALVGLLGIGVMRALLYSERLSLVELVLPAIIALVRFDYLGKRIPRWKQNAWALAPLAGFCAAIVMFGTFEYFRSWRIHEKKFDSIAEFTFMRVSSYYNLSVNSGAMLLDEGQRFPIPIATTLFFWQFPLVKLSPLSYDKLTGRDPDKELIHLLYKYANPEINNDGGLLQPAYDFGVLGVPLFWFVLAIGVGYAYHGFLAGRLTGLVFYPMFFVGMLEVPRILYFTSQRVFPSFFLLAMFILFSRYQIPTWLRSHGMSPNSRRQTPVAEGASA